MFFTRLPFWRIFHVESHCFKQVINYWAVAGWITSGIMVATLWLSAHLFPITLAIVIAIITRILTTGALHEDGLADFFDGFGGGHTKERILAIMKDSHIGTFGVLALIGYLSLLTLSINSLPLQLACYTLLAADPFCKLVSSQITRFLPYARSIEQSKSHMIYLPMSTGALIISSIFGLLPTVALLPPPLWIATIPPLFVFGGLTYFIRKKITGYTGDCCGAIFLLCELSFILSIVALYHS